MHDAPLSRRGRARPVADAPVAALVADADELARDWLLALLAVAPLEGVGRVPAGELAARAPELCAAMARALADDEALDALGPGSLAASAGHLAGASDPADAAAAVEALRGVLWNEALAALRRPDPGLVAALADRLAAVAAAVTAATLAAPREPGVSRPREDVSRPREADGPAPEPPPASPEAPVSGADGMTDPSARAARSPFERSPIAVADGTAAAEFRARDLRPRIGDGSPLELLERSVAAHLADQRTLAVLLVELDGVERLLAADVAGEAGAAIRRAEAAIEALLRPGDAARREAPGRIWVTLAGTGPAGARALALRVAAAVERDADHRGTPLTASVGVAVFPVDAADAHTLADHAEDALFSARASGSRGAPPPTNPTNLR